MEFRSVSDLNRDIVRWSATLPRDIDLVVGVPRSGLLAAALLALHMQLPLTDVRGLQAGRLLGGGARLGEVEEQIVIEKARRILVVDDSVYTGQAITQAKASLGDFADRTQFAAVYASPMSKKVVDHYHSVVPQPRAFEWNILHHPLLEQSCMDIDGVLCPDPTYEQNDDGVNYLEFLCRAPVRLVPSVKVAYLVTSRLEKYRAETEGWLRQAGVQYGELVMHQAGTAAERRQANDHGTFKAGVFRKLGAPLFIESDIDQAVVIANGAGKPVYCTDERQMIYPGAVAGVKSVPRLSDKVRWRLSHKLALEKKRVARALRR